MNVRDSRSVAFAAAIVLSLCAVGVLGGSMIIVNSPTQVVQQFVTKYPPNGDIPDAPAMFGMNPYGNQVMGALIYASDQANGNSFGCGPISKANFPPPEWGTRVILLIDRGHNCTFVTKVQNAQNAGASAVVIVDNTNSWWLPIMADDGYGATITTPSMIISQADGQILKNGLAQGPIVRPYPARQLSLSPGTETLCVPPLSPCACASGVCPLSK
jgi:hypothetical protein